MATLDRLEWSKELLSQDDVQRRETEILAQWNTPTVPIDERAVLDAAHDTRVMTPKEMQQLQARHKADELRQRNEQWRQLYAQLPPQSKPQPQPQPSQTNQKKYESKFIQKIANMVTDLKRFKDLPQRTTLQKLDACLLDNGRVYITVGFVVLIILVIVTIVLLCRK